MAAPLGFITALLLVIVLLHLANPPGRARPGPSFQDLPEMDEVA
jgi:hypothetical protein